MLSKKHQEMLYTESALSPEIVEARGYRTIEKMADLWALGFAKQQSRQVPGLLIPLHTPDGKNPVNVYRPDIPRIVDGKKLADGTRAQKIIKYEYPKGEAMHLDVPPASQGDIQNPDVPLYITEGQKKADALASRGLCALALLGVWNFKGTSSKSWLPDWDDVALTGREILLIFDSDVIVKPQVQKALRRFSGVLINKGAIVTPVLLPPKSDGKNGIDDWFAAGGTLDELQMIITNSKTWFEPVLKAHQQAMINRSSDYIDQMSLMGYDVRMNELDDTIEVNQEPITDAVEATIRSKFRDRGMGKELGAIKDAYTRYAYQSSYHPIREYLEGLEYDGGDHIYRLSLYFDDKQDVFGLWLRKWLIGAVAKAFSPAQNPMLVLDGPQNVGKSYFAYWLGRAMPKYFMEGPIQPENKDFVIRLANKWIWEVSELGATTRKADREALKAFITQENVVARKPYGRHDINKPALASLIGTINNEAGFLNDPTGSRRFMVCTLTEIDRRYSTEIDVHQVWAEAYHHWKSGERWQLTDAERKRQYEINRQYEEEEPLESLIKQHYRLVQPDIKTWMPTSQILETIGMDTRHTGHARRVGSVLNSLGCKSERGELPNGQRVRGWWGLEQIIIDSTRANENGHNGQ